MAQEAVRDGTGGYKEALPKTILQYLIECMQLLLPCLAQLMLAVCRTQSTDKLLLCLAHPMAAICNVVHTAGLPTQVDLSALPTGAA